MSLRTELAPDDPGLTLALEPKEIFTRPPVVPDNWVPPQP